MPKARRLFLLCTLITTGVATLGTLAYLHGRNGSVARVNQVKHPPSRLFASEYPVSSAFKNELIQMMDHGQLKAENHQLIRNTVLAANDALNVPPALLWCLLFQESRLNHLKGVGAPTAALGLGQFSHFSFFEVNYQLTRFTPDNLFLMENVLGSDPRPIAPTLTPKTLPSSYFYIPTAVIASASYLNNRYLQLRAILDRKGIDYDPEILWMQAAMAYNKGTRSVLSLWNDALRKGGRHQLEQLTTNENVFFAAASDDTTLRQILKRIWPAASAGRYAHELRIHMNNLRACALKESETNTF